jgi:hypothetical protein
MALSRRLQLGENKRIELRAEAFNVLNKFRPNDPNSLQFALKYVF